ncbi:PAS domain S-box-containing protein/diguanylate cyclase (GGDEF)-like protein [Rhodovulum visakhapatnamense]|uniref:PAS domain S-box-containing protein/diguanylate cyclase (GGDEF)-like protein n=2 Tax=Rhodovulum visakhapatnamense TaxID=364297 RepID=A0A4R8FXU6_9RHOB|nr:PAS domain S-box-containing protein/diguanylate cyclase (GGDEF)-like protein [Rhodovulum visakhapatnamense]
MSKERDPRMTLRRAGAPVGPAALRARLADLLAALAVPAWATGSDGKVLAANSAAATLLERASADWAGLGDGALLPERCARRLQGARATLLHGARARVRYRGGFLTGTGRHRLLDCSLTRLAGIAGAVLVQAEPVGLCGASADPRAAETCQGEIGSGVEASAWLPPGMSRHHEVLQRAAEAAGFAQWYLDPARRRIWVADGVPALLGFAPGEVALDSSWLRARLHPEDRPAMRAVAAQLIRGGSESMRIDCRLRHRDGSYLWVEATARRIVATPGRRTILCGSLSDVTHFKDHEARLQQALFDARRARTEAAKTEGLMRIATEGAGFGHWTFDPATGTYWLSDACFRSLGYRPGSIDTSRIGFREVIHPDDAGAARAALEALLAGESELLHIDSRLRTADGSWRWHETTARLVPLAEVGLPPLVCGISRDITARKTHEQDLARALEAARRARDEAEAARGKLHLQATILRVSTEYSNVVPWHAIPALGLVRADAHLAAMLGYPPGHRIGSAEFRDMIHPDDAREALGLVDALYRRETEAFSAEFRVRRGDDGWCWVASKARWLDGAGSGLPDMVCGTLTEITASKANEARLAEALAAAEIARKEARASEQMLRTAAICGNMGAWSICAERGEAWMTAEGFRQLGYEPGDFVPDDAGWRDLIHPDDLPATATAMDAVIRGEAEVYDYDHRIRHKDGSYHWYRTVARLIDRRAEGLPPLLAGAHTCTDRQKQNEARLSEALAEAEAARAESQTREEMLRTSALCSGIAHWVVCPDTGEGWIPEGTYGLLGYAPDAFPPENRCWRGLIHPEDSDSAVAGMRDLLDYRADGYTHEHRLQHADGSYHWYRTVARRVDRSATDQPDLIAGALVSIDHVKENERRLAEAAEAARLAGERLNTLADNAPGALFVFRVTPAGQFDLPYFSAKLPALMGLTRAEIEADSEALLRRVDPDHIQDLRLAISKSRRGLTPFEMRLRVRMPEGEFRWVLVASLPFRREGGIVVWFGNVFDITEKLAVERRAAEAAEEVRRAHERLRSVALIAPVGLYEFRRKPDGSSDFPYTSPQFEDIMGLTRAEIEARDRNVMKRVDPVDLQRVADSTDASARDLSLWSERFRIRHPERGQVWLSGAAAPRRQDDGTIVWAGALHDVTADVRREAELRQAHQLAETMRAENERQALHDGLTGLPNRRYYDQVLADRIEAARTGDGPRDAVLIRVDLDHFKYVNDTLGHEAGDRVLIRVAEELRGALRAADFAARIGGDEFSILLGPGMSAENAREVVERVQVALARPLTYEGRLCRFGASFGIAHTEDIDAMGAELQLFADAALYRAKEGGRNRMEFFTADLHRNILNDREIGAELHEALERDEFVPFFQPQVSAEDGHLVGAETLLRWRHPEKGLLAPDAFMHVAEQLRIVAEIDRIMMQKARGALERWRAQGLVLPKISFNVSSGRMHDPDVVSLARSMVGSGTKVTFELLESILVEEESDAFRFHLAQIREAGIDIEIDDFGSGHASIIGLMEIAPQALKVDRRIVRPVATDMRARNLVRAIIEIAETLGIATVVEGVETAEQATVLRGIGCNIFQGYLFAKPMSEDDFLAYALAHPEKRA